MTDSKSWPSLAELDPEFDAVAKSIGGAPDLGAFPDIETLRKFLADAKAQASATGGAIPGVKETDHQVSMRDGHKILVRTYAAESPTSGGGPLAVLYHGGGWCIGDVAGEEALSRLLVSKLGMAVASVDYRLGPEFKFPFAHHDCYDATKWAVSEAASFGADPAKGFLLGGTSAGGNLTATVSHLWRDDKMSPPVTGCHLMIPALCHSSAMPEEFKEEARSEAQLPNAAILSKKSMDLFRDNFIPNEKDLRDPLFSPLIWPTGHRGLPPHYFQVCGADPLRDEALIYERLLREKEGVKTRLDIYKGQPHGFWSIFPQMKAAQKFVEDSVKGVEWLLQQK
ncbi:related to Putative sterigmatocystin biosynthesis lipase/esterase STCI [Ramularia collo-cygni]|uniref:Related to Putative sterigmatocystin biosynthesis lipase/esterase STCI n=1 Tax=Ramularia collo-cygni TaxID=112498 RepID=A0A2D3UPW2_9PEZI|nr:related to Putative sterigmatocystin biosynthesis lipase/esterase STCI [Ramularia collo-cygni]CZT17551.1 related to Putative sterigmatocystin biosynthesis lipase/esterase STCI [Ramularia collo-cygni]